MTMAETGFERLKSLLEQLGKMDKAKFCEAMRLINDFSVRTASGAFSVITPTEMLYLSQQVKSPVGKCGTLYFEMLSGAIQEAIKVREITPANTKPMIVAGPDGPCDHLTLNGQTFTIRQRNCHKGHKAKMLYQLRDLKPPPPHITGTWVHHNKGNIEVEILGFRLTTHVDGYILNDLEGQIIGANAKAHHGCNRRKQRSTETFSETSFRASETTWSELFTALDTLSMNLKKPIFLRPDFVIRGIENGRIFDDLNGRFLQKPPDLINLQNAIEATRMVNEAKSDASAEMADFLESMHAL